jgi:hypothetical protein
LAIALLFAKPSSAHHWLAPLQRRRTAMDLPPLQLEMVRFGLQGQPAAADCRSADSGMKASLSGVLGEAPKPCRLEAGRIRIDEPPGWPALPPPPVPTLQ